MRFVTRLLVLACLAAAVLVPAAAAADRMWVGFHDDPELRFDGSRTNAMDLARSNEATVLRTLVEWHKVAPTRPASASDPFDPAYRFDDIDEFVRNAQQRGMEVLITIWGTPGWANGDQKPQAMPRNVADFQAFSRAVASRYSGRFSGYPFVRFYSIWNESNLATFFVPQFNARGQIVSPRNYARLAAAGYAGIKAGNPRGQVAVGETSSNGRDKKRPGLTDTVAPATFMKGVAAANPRLKFDAWAHHPYPFRASAKPTQVVKWPNVTLSSLPRFETELKRWFKRKTVPIWVTEYGHETNPPDRSFGISYATQAAYLRQAIAMAKKLPYVGMFIWFVYQDNEGQPWDSGLYARSGAAKGSSPNAFARSAKPLDARNAVYTFRRGTLTPSVTLNTRRYCVGDTAGEPIGMTWRIFIKNRLIAVDQQTSPLRVDCSITARLRFPRGGVQKGTTYRATFVMNDINGTVLNRTLTIRAK